jgi:hypothetical protein
VFGKENVDSTYKECEYALCMISRFTFEIEYNAQAKGRGKKPPRPS